MHVNELLLLLADIRRNTPVYYNQDKAPLPVTGVAWTKADAETPAALLQLGPPGHPRRQWELVALLQEPQRPTDEVYVVTETGLVPIFGFRLVDQHIWLG